MDPARTAPLPRDAIGEFIKSPRGIRAFEDLQGDTTSLYAAVTTASFVTLGDEPSLGSERVLTPTGDLVGTDGGPNAPYTLGLSNTTVVPGAYGSASKTVSFTVNAKGRITAAAEFPLNTSNVAEGSNLYYTDMRARAALSGTGGVSYDSGTGAISLDPASPRNVDHSAVSVTAGVGLTGGGDISASRTLDLANTAVTPGTYSPVISITVDAQGRITAIS